MPYKTTAMVLGALLLSACGGHDHSDSSGSASASSSITTPVSPDTSEILSTYAQQPSETGSPVPVNDGAFTISGTSETATPIAVNAGQ